MDNMTMWVFALVLFLLGVDIQGFLDFVHGLIGG